MDGQVCMPGESEVLLAYNNIASRCYMINTARKQYASSMVDHDFIFLCKNVEGSGKIGVFFSHFVLIISYASLSFVTW